MESAFQEAAALKAWLDPHAPRSGEDERPTHPSLRIAGVDLEAARSILRGAKVTMVVVAPDLEELSVATAKPIAFNVESNLPVRTSSGRLISYHRIANPKVALPSSSIRIPTIVGTNGEIYCCGHPFR